MNKHLKAESFNEIYMMLCHKLIYNPQFYLKDTQEILDFSFTITNPKNRVLLNSRNASINYMFGELEWYLRGSNKVKHIKNYSPFWETISDDGKTNNSAYGYLLQKKHKFDQVLWVINELKNSPESRRAVIHFRTPNKNHATKDTPCTLSMQFILRREWGNSAYKLFAITTMRSNDVYFGTPYDVWYFTILQELIANSLNVKLGTYTHHANSMHLYLRDFKTIRLAALDKKIKVELGNNLFNGITYESAIKEEFIFNHLLDLKALLLMEIDERKLKLKGKNNE